jgi:hypothetical protein
MRFTAACTGFSKISETLFWESCLAETAVRVCGDYVKYGNGHIFVPELVVLVFRYI